MPRREEERRRDGTDAHFAAAGEGIATNVLADRLERLVAAGILERNADPDDGRKGTYRLTRKGMDLAPVLVEIVVWAAAHERTAARPALVKQMRNRRDAFIDGSAMATRTAARSS